MNNEPNQTPVPSMPNNESNQGSPENTYGPIERPPEPPKHKWYKNKVLWVIFVLVLIVGGAGGSYAYYAAIQSQQAANDTNETVDAEVKTQQVLEPYAVTYVETAFTTTADCQQSSSKLSQYGLDGSEPLDVSMPSGGQSPDPSLYDTYEEKVIMGTIAGCGDKEGPVLWLSNDSGKTYEKLFTGKPIVPATGFADQITSVIFSDDGKSVVFGLLSTGSEKNTVKRIDLESKNATDLFTSSQRGVFLFAHDADNQQVYYREGCYNCGGSTHNHTLSYDMKTKKRTVFADFGNSAGYDMALNSSMTRVLRVASIEKDFLAGISAYTIEEYDIATKTLKKHATFDENTNNGQVRAGYTMEGFAYYTKGKSFYLLSEAGESQKLFDASQPISYVYHAGKGKIVYGTGAQSTGNVFVYDIIDTQKSVELLSYDYPSSTLGVSLHFKDVE